ncbi:unnamed protein product [Sphenostylis stenocarpa]|uniref:TAZ-type domain-containing protein n=1 Tax=Sphenostylis stenocarpa TaxID=92480 RepID=A0AA86W0R3_9FABA|nr:unnamed protein product [Sphenostylis stenocarpa]
MAFVAFIYSSRCTEEDMDKYGMHLLALSHVYLVTQLKQRCIKGLSERVNTENVVDVLQLARLCDAPDLYLKCVKHLTNHFKVVKETEGWRFLQNHDPCLELDILRLMEEHEKVIIAIAITDQCDVRSGIRIVVVIKLVVFCGQRKRKTRKRREEGRLYAELSEAMECLEHICTEGCTDVGPYDVEVGRGKGPCSKFGTCQGVQVLIRHFATCERVKGGCLRCKRMWQLFRLHSSICLRHDSCKVPLCRQIRLRMEQENKKGDARWQLLVRKVASAKAMSSLALPKRKRVVEISAEGP